MKIYGGGAVSAEIEGSIRDILVRILDRAESTQSELKHLERALGDKLDTVKDSYRKEVKEVDNRVRKLEQEQAVANEQIRGVASKVAAAVSVAVVIIGAAAQYFLGKLV